MLKFGPAFLVAAAWPIAAWAQSQAEGDLARAAREAGQWTLYNFSITETTEGTKAGSDPVEGTYDKEKGFLSRSGGRDTIRVGSKEVRARKDGTWRARTRDGAPDLPTALLADLERSFRTVEAAQEEGDTVYSGELTAAGSAYLLDGLEKRLPDVRASKITGKVVVNGEGRIVKVEILGVFEGPVDGVETRATVARVIAFTDVNSATFEIPEAAQAELDQLP